LPYPIQLRPLALGGCVLFAACWSPAVNKDAADRQVYDILEQTSSKVTGVRKSHAVERPVDTLRTRLASAAEPVKLSLLEALDVAAENSREFQRQKESLYLNALSLTRARHDFDVIFGGGGSAEVSGEADRTANATLRDDLSAAVNTA
jgi:hypothetical protein